MDRTVIPMFYRHGEVYEFIINVIVDRDNMPKKYSYYPQLYKREEFKLVYRTIGKTEEGKAVWQHCYVKDV